MKELYWMKVNRNDTHPIKFQKYLSFIKDSLKENFPDREWLVTSDDIDIQNLSNSNSLVPISIPIEVGVVAYSPFTGEKGIVTLNTLQKELLRSYKKPKPSLWVSSRQSGMSTMLAEITLDHALHADYLSTKILVISNKFINADEIRLQILDILRVKYPDVKILVNNKNEIQLDNRTSITFTGARSTVNSLRGVAYSLIVADLVSFYHNSFFEELFQAFPFAYPKIILASTSLGGSNKDFTKAAITKRYQNFEFDVVRMSVNDIAFLENREVKENILTRKKWMGEDQYLSEYVAQPKLDN